MVFREIGARLERHLARCEALGTHPQLWVASPSVADYLGAVAGRWRASREAPDVRRFGDLLSYAVERRAVPGQQALLTVTEALAAHWTIGGAPGEEHHLAALLTWLDPPADGDLWAAIEAAETVPMACAGYLGRPSAG